MAEQSEETGDTGEQPAWPGERLAANKADLLRGTIGGGKRQAVTLLRQPEGRASEVRGLAGLVDAYVASGEEGPQRSALFDELDSREKASFSYRLGLGVATMLAQRELAIPWVMHVGALLTSGTARLDPEDAPKTVLVGLSRSGRWHLVKAKARSSEMTDSIVQASLDDVAQLASVNDRPPVERRACVTALGESPFRVNFVAADEEAKDKGAGDEPARLAADPSAYVTEYYAQFSFLTSLDVHRRQLGADEGCGNLPDAVVADLGGPGYEIGLLEPLYSALLPPEDRQGSSEGLDEAVPSEGGWVPEDLDRARQAGLSIGRDGVVVTGPVP